MNLVTMKGRVSIPAEEKTSARGRKYTQMSVAVQIEDSTEKGDTKPLFVRLMTQSVRTATIMERMEKGESICFQGRLTRRRWTGNDGAERETWTCWVDSIQSINTISTAHSEPRSEEPVPEQPASDALEDLEGDIPF